MKKPFMTMHKPYERDYQVRIKEITVYSYFSPFSGDCPSCGLAECECEKEEEDQEDACWFSSDKDQPTTPNLPFDQMTLQKITELLPPDISPNEVKMSIHTDSGDYPTGTTIRFYYTKTLPADMAAYERDLARYYEEFAEYSKQLATYEKEQKQKEVSELEEKLNKLKGELDR